MVIRPATKRGFGAASANGVFPFSIIFPNDIEATAVLQPLARFHRAVLTPHV